MSRDLWDRPACRRVLDEPAMTVLTIGQVCAVLGAVGEAVDDFRARGCPDEEYPLAELRAAAVRLNAVLEGGWPS